MRMYNFNHNVISTISCDGNYNNNNNDNDNDNDKMLKVNLHCVCILDNISFFMFLRLIILE